MTHIRFINIGFLRWSESIGASGTRAKNAVNPGDGDGLTQGGSVVVVVLDCYCMQRLLGRVFGAVGFGILYPKILSKYLVLSEKLLSTRLRKN